MPRRRHNSLRSQAQQAAAAQVNPEIRATRRQTHQEVGSLNSLADALQGSITLGEQSARRIGGSIQGAERAKLLEYLAQQRVAAQAGANVQIRQVQQEGAQSVADLITQRQQAASSALADAQQAQAQRQQEIQDALRQHRWDLQESAANDKRDFLYDILKDKLNIGGDSTSKGGMTPTQKRAAKEEHDNAAFLALQNFQKLKAAALNPDDLEQKQKDQLDALGVSGKPPSQWGDQAWNELVSSVMGGEGVSNVNAAQRAVQAIQDHVQPDIGGGIDTLKRLALGAASTQPVVASPLAAIAQLLGGRR